MNTALVSKIDMVAVPDLERLRVHRFGRRLGYIALVVALGFVVVGILAVSVRVQVGQHPRTDVVAWVSGWGQRPRHLPERPSVSWMRDWVRERAREWIGRRLGRISAESR